MTISKNILMKSNIDQHLMRDAELVCHDVANYLVTKETAGRVYGVVLQDGQMAVDDVKTRELRDRKLGERKKRGNVPVQASVTDRLRSENIEGKELAFGYAISDFLEVRTTEKMPGLQIIGCGSCHEPLCATNENLREHTKRSQSSDWNSLSSVYSLRENSPFFLVEYSCPSCGALLSIDIMQKDEAGTTRAEFLIA